jgi:putative ABC transport system ATP-binding protein
MTATDSSSTLDYPSPAGADPAVPTVFCRGITKSYGTGGARVTALRGIDLEVAPGQLMMLVGPSGCGKTTLISVVAGILDQDEGECRVIGHDFKHMPPGDKTRYRGRTIGFVFQQFNLLPTLNAAENVSVPLLINGMKRKPAIERAKAMLDRVGLADRWHSLPSQLSGGQQQRVAIARALVHDPRLIVCDEPTSALDHETGHKVMELLRTVAMGHGRSLIIVTHDARIFEFADRIAQMDDGQILRVVDSPEELIHPSHLTSSPPVPTAGDSASSGTPA